MGTPKTIPSCVRAEDFTASGSVVRLPSEALGLPVPADAPRVDYVVTAVYGERFTLGTGTASPADARAVLPGQPVTLTYRVTDPAAIKRIESGMREPPTACGIMLGTPIEVQPDLSKIVGAVTNEQPPKRDLPPIPEPGFYWARPGNALDAAIDGWEPVMVAGGSATGRRYVYCLKSETECTVLEWGPRLEPPGATPSRSFLTYAEVQLLKGALGAALLPAPFGGEPEVSSKLTGEEHARLVAALARVTLQPAECTHDAWEWPMARCPGCGAEGVGPRSTP